MTIHLKIWGRILRFLANRLVQFMDIPVGWKRYLELLHWRTAEYHPGVYERIFTKPFNLTKEFYRDKAILDIGCGPFGSLDWAYGIAYDIIGIDPLTPEYRKADLLRNEKMDIVEGSVEFLPIPKGRSGGFFPGEGYFSVISCFNVLNHVEDLDKALSEMVRVLAPGGSLLIISEIDKPKRACEPITISSQEIISKLSPPLEHQFLRIYWGTLWDLYLGNPPDRSSKERVMVARFDKERA